MEIPTRAVLGLITNIDMVDTSVNEAKRDRAIAELKMACWVVSSAVKIDAEATSDLWWAIVQTSKDLGVRWTPWVCEAVRKITQQIREATDRPTRSGQQKDRSRVVNDMDIGRIVDYPCDVEPPAS